MKFSEAMLLGLPEIAFTNSTWLRVNEDCSRGAYGNKECRGCLVGAALYSVGIRMIRSTDLNEDPFALENLIREYWPDLPRLICDYCPVCDEHGKWFFSTWCTHLATHYRHKAISAEQIADWIRKYETSDDQREHSGASEDQRTEVKA